MKRIASILALTPYLALSQSDSLGIIKNRPYYDRVAE